MPQPPKDLPGTLGDLRKSGYKTTGVKDEVRRNLIARLRSGKKVFEGIVGYDRTVIPMIQNAILARQDFILLGLRGQAKTRILRALVNLLDEWIPAVAGSPIHDDPFAPVTKQARERIAVEGDATPIEWIHRAERYNEKLATPDVTIADLIGDVDPIKAANEKRTLADEEVIHFGLIPRTNRGIFGINELPDLNTRIQVGLLNILEERDVQIRGFPLRLPLDVLFVFTANPEDYTSRGKIITPLKDRIGSQILTHYPASIRQAVEITRQEAWVDRGTGLELVVPDLIRELIEEITFEARRSEFVDQSSGVSARASITAMENLVSNLEKRALIAGENRTVARICDLYATLPAIIGKIELVYEGEQRGVVAVAKRIIGNALRRRFAKVFPNAYRPRGSKVRRGPEVREEARAEEDSVYRTIIQWFAKGNVVDITDRMPAAEYEKALDAVPTLRGLAVKHMKPGDPELEPLAMEFLLEGLYQNSLIAKEDLDGGVVYKDMLKTMFESVEA